MTPDPRCTECGQHVPAFTIRRDHTFGVGPYEHLCADCVPLPADCASWVEFGSTAREAGAMRDEAAS